MRKKRILRITTVLILIGIFSAFFLNTGCTTKNEGLNEHNRYGYESVGNENIHGPKGGGYGMGNGPVNVNAYPKETLSQSEIEAMKEAIEDEYKARDVYIDVMKKFGEVRPFTNIERAEEMHIAMLEDLFKKYGLSVPEDEMKNTAEKIVSGINSVSEACKVGVQAEIENYDMYDRLFKQVDNKDIIAVFTALRDASQYRHLPAFKQCAGSE